MEVESVQILARMREWKGKESGCCLYDSSSPHMQKPGPLPTATLASCPMVYLELATGLQHPTQAGRSWADREYPGTPHWAGSGRAGASREWGSPQCAGCCSELPSGERSFLPEESQSEGVIYIRNPKPPSLSLVRWALRPRRTHIPTWFLALWSAPALTSMSMISKLPDQAARWMTVKPCFPKKREV